MSSDSKLRRELIADGYATVQQTAQFLACSKSRVYQLVQGNVLSHGKHGGRIAIPWVAVRAYAEQRLVIGSVA